MDEIRRLPHNTEAEQAVLGSILIDPRCISEVVDKLIPDDFYLSVHRDIFETVYGMFLDGRDLDPVLIMSAMKSRGVYDEQTSRDYLMRLLDMTTTSAHVGRYIDLVLAQSLLRQVSEASTKIHELAVEPQADASAVLENAEQSIYEIRKGKSDRGLYPIIPVLIEVARNIEQLVKDGGRLPGIKTGFDELDYILGGLINSNLVVIAARPGFGKTAIALNIALNATRASGKEVVFFSLEMSREQLVTRLLSYEARVASDALREGRLSGDAWKSIGEASARLSKVELLFDDNPAITVGEMKARCRRLKNLGLIVIDYLQLMKGTQGKRYSNRVEEVSDISRSLKIMAKELGVPVLCCAQLSRENVKEKRAPKISDLRESGSIEQDADSVILIHRNEIEGADENTPVNDVELIIAKNRHGRTGKINLWFEGEYSSFTMKDWKHDEL